MRFYWDPELLKNASLNLSSFENCICVVTMGADFKILTKVDFLCSFILFWCWAKTLKYIYIYFLTWQEKEQLLFIFLTIYLAEP